VRSRSGARGRGVFARIHRGLAKTTGLWQIPQKDDDGPHFFFGEDAFGSGHTRGRDAILENPHELAVGVGLHGRRFEGGNRGRHAIGKGDAGVLRIESVAGDAIVREGDSAVFDGSWGNGQGIAGVFSADRQRMFDAGHDGGFPFSGRGDAASGEKDGQKTKTDGGAQIHGAPEATT